MLFVVICYSSKRKLAQSTSGPWQVVLFLAARHMAAGSPVPARGRLSPYKSGIILLCNTITYSPHLCPILLVRSKSHSRPHSEEITTHRHQHREVGSWGRATLESLCHKAPEVFVPLQVYGSQSLPHIKATSATTPFEIAPPDPGESHRVGDATQLGSGQ